MLELHQQQDHKPISLPKLPTMWIPAVDSINCIRDELEIDTETGDDDGKDENVVYKSDAPIPEAVASTTTRWRFCRPPKTRPCAWVSARRVRR